MIDFSQSPKRADGDSSKWIRYAGKDVIPAWVADTEFPAAFAIQRALQERLQHGVFGYAEPTPALIETVIAYFGRRWHWDISPDWLVFLPGLGCAIHAVCRMAEGGDVLTPRPIYHVFRKAPALAGARLVDVDMTLENGEWKLPMENAAVSEKSKVFQLCNPHNPNGKVFSRDELLEIGGFCVANNLLLCADEVHADLILDDDAKHLPVAALDDNIARCCITLQSPSKAFNVAGLNFAVAVIPDADLRARFHASLAGRVITHLNPFGMAAATAAWGGDCDNWLVAANAHLRQNRDILSAAVADIDGIEMSHLASTYLAWLNVRALHLDDAPAHFEAHGLAMSPGEHFGDADYMRLNFGCTAESLHKMIDILRTAAAK